MALDPEKEFEGLNRKHKLDDSKFIAWVKKAIKSKTIRVNRYIISDLIDGKMLQIEVEKFINKMSAGTRSVKGYLSEEKCDTLVTLLDNIPRISYRDTRDNVQRERPAKLIRGKSNLRELDLDNLFSEED